MTTPESRRASSTSTVRCPVISQLGHVAFTCTFCWHISATPPHVVGCSARLACESCYNALLDLSVCWVCGEVVVRGDSCVSLGWCFWHKSCYGCLICGNRMVVQGVTVKEVFSERSDVEGIGDADGLAVTMGQAKEIEEIPLCAHCYVEVGAEEMDSRTVVNGALRRMDFSDGGLSRKRYEDGRQAWGDESKSERTQRLQDNATCPVPLDSRIYVSIRDPTAPAFKPSPAKPIPRWMATVPTQGDETNDYGLESELIPDHHSPQPSGAELSLQRRLSSYTPSSDRTVKPHTRTPEPLRPPTPPNTMSGSATAQIVTPEPIPVSYTKIFRYTRAGFIDSESLKRPSSRLDRIREEFSHVESRTPSPYLTPPEWPLLMYGDKGSSGEHGSDTETQDTTVQDAGVKDKSRQTSVFSHTSSRTLPSLISPTQTPTPSRLPRASIASEPSSLPQHPRLPRKSTMLRAKIAAHHPPASHSAIPMSSEFLERYGVAKNKETPRPSALLKKTPPSSRRSSHEPQPILARLKKNSRSGPTTGLVDETTVVTETDRSSTPKQFSFDSTDCSK
jgi:hypothetical protein